MATAGSGRNFRSHYYEKVGFRGVEEKKSLDILLSEKPIEREKLQSFCLRFSVPGMYRSSVWRTLLGVLPPYTTSQDWVWEQRVTQFQELHRVLKLTRHLTGNPAEDIAIAWLLNSNRLKYDVLSQLREPEVLNFIRIVSSLQNIFETQEEVFWVGKGLHSFLTAQADPPSAARDCLTKILRGEDSELLSHLEETGLLVDICGPRLLATGLASLLSPALLVRLWDKVVAGSCKILVFTLAAAIIIFRTEVMSAASAEEIFSLLTNMKETQQEMVFSLGLENWELEGCPLLYVSADSKFDAADPNRKRLEDSEGGGKSKETEKGRLDHRLSREIHVAM